VRTNAYSDCSWNFWVEARIDAEHNWGYIAQRKTNCHLLLNITLQNYSRKKEDNQFALSSL